MGPCSFLMQTRFWSYEQKNKNQDKYLRMELKIFLKKKFFLDDFPVRPLSNGLTIFVIAVLEGK